MEWDPSRRQILYRSLLSVVSHISRTLFLLRIFYFYSVKKSNSDGHILFSFALPSYSFPVSPQSRPVRGNNVNKISYRPFLNYATDRNWSFIVARGFLNFVENHFKITRKSKLCIWNAVDCTLRVYGVIEKVTRILIKLERNCNDEGILVSKV